MQLELGSVYHCQTDHKEPKFEGFMPHFRYICRVYDGQDTWTLGYWDIEIQSNLDLPGLSGEGKMAQ